MAEGQNGGKEIKFSFVVDQASAQSVMKTLKDLTDQAEKFAKALQGAAGAMTGGGSFFGGGTAGGKASGPASTITKAAGRAGGGGGSSAITNVVLENAKAFKSMASMSGDALKSMQDILKKSVDDQKRSITDLDKTIENLGKRYQQLKKDQQDAVSQAQRLGIDPKLVGAQYGNRLSATGQQLAAAQGQQVANQANLAAMGGAPPPPGLLGRMGQGWQQGGIMGLLGTSMGNGPFAPGGMGANALQMMGMGGLSRMALPAFAFHGLNMAFDQSREGTRAYSSAEAERGRMVNSRVKALRQGDTSFIAKLRHLQSDPEAMKDLEAQYKGAGADFEGVKEGIGSTIKQLMPGGSGGMLGKGLTTSALQGKKMEQFLKMVDQVGDYTSFQDRADWDEMRGATRGSRNAIALAGGPANRLENIPLRDARGNPIASTGVSQFKDRYLMRDAELTRRGFDINQEHAAKMQMLGSAGEEGRRYGYNAMSAQAGGYGAYGGLLAQSIRLGQGDTLARYAIGGGIDKTAGMQLGAGIMGMNPFGITNDAGIMAVAQNSGAFTGSGMDFTTANRMQAGLQAGNVFSNQGDGYQSGANLLSAIKTLGPGAGYKAQDYLANGISFKDMVNMSETGDLSQRAKSFGIKQGDITKQLNSMIDSASNLAVDDSANDPASKAMRKFRESGMSFSDYKAQLRKQKGGKEEFTNLWEAISDAKGIGEGESLGLRDIQWGMGTGKGARKGAVGAGKLGDVEAQEAENEAKEKERLAGLTDKFSKEKIAELGAAKDAANAFKSAGSNLSTQADILAGKLGDLGKAVDAAAMNMTKLMDPKDANKFIGNAMAADQNRRAAAEASAKAKADAQYEAKRQEQIQRNWDKR